MRRKEREIPISSARREESFRLGRLTLSAARACVVTGAIGVSLFGLLALRPVISAAAISPDRRAPESPSVSAPAQTPAAPSQPLAMGAPSSTLIRKSARGVADVASYGDRDAILFSNGLRFDPVREGEPDLPASLTAEPLREGEPGAFLVQLDGPPQRENLDALSYAGANVISYIPNYTYLVRAPAESKTSLEALPFVRWVGAYHPAYKLSGQREMNEASGTRTLTVLLFPDADLARLAGAMRDLGGAVLEATDSGRNKIVRLDVDMSRVVEIAAQNDVAWVEPWHPLQLHNVDAQWVVQTNQMNVRSVWDRGLRGQGQVVHTSDSGIRTSHNQFRDPSVPIETWGQYPAHRKLIAYLPTIEGNGVLFGDASGASYHGSHTAGTVVGNDSPVGGVDARDGMAPEAKIFFHDGGALDNSIIAPSDLNLIFQPAYIGNAAGAARISSNSWGGATAGDYTILDMTVDQFMWDHKDFLAFFSTGNEGTPGSVGSPASNKSGVGSGATGNGLASGAMMPLTSQGPTADGRRKPTICSPGLQLSSANGANDTGYQALTGTSMSCPSKAGATLLIRQYLTEGWYPTGAPTPENAFDPSGALLKAMAMTSTDNDMPGLVIPNNTNGWGRIKIENILYFPGDAARTAIVDETSGLATGEFVEYEFDVTDNSVPLKITLCWTDKEGNPTALRQIVNDLNLTVTDPLNVAYLGNFFAGGESAPAGIRDTLNVEECVRRSAPLTGTWKVRVDATNVPFSLQPFALVVSGGLNGATGSVRLDKTAYGRDDVIEVRVEDLDAAGPLSVEISSDTESEPETITLSGSSGIFTGSIATNILPAAAGDGALSLSNGDVITATYDDANPAATRSATATADFSGPIITGVSASGADVSVTIRWDTDAAGGSKVYYGTTADLGEESPLDANLVTAHTVVLSGLLPETNYNFDVESTDRTGNTTRDDAGGNHYRFNTGKTGDLLFVIGDVSFTQADAYASALASLGWDASFLSGGTISDALVGDTTRGLRSHAAVWWQVGSEQYPPFEDTARESLTKYLEGGGRLSVVSHDVAWAFSEPTSGFYTPAREAWIENDLHINWLEDPATWPAIQGVAGDPISGSYAAGALYSPLRAGGSGDEVSLVAGTGTGAFVWKNTDTSPDNIAVRWENGVPNGNPNDAVWGGTPTKVVTNCLEWTSIVDAATRSDVLDKTLIWLIGRDHPDAAVVGPNGGETITTNEATISWTETAFGGTTIGARSLYYSPDGGATWTLITTSAGPSPYAWDLTGLGNGAEYRVRIVLTDSGTPGLRGKDESNASFTINRPGGDSRGPVVVAGSITVDPDPIDNLETAAISATLTDAGYGGSNIVAAEWSRGTFPAPAGGGNPMSGGFGAATVEVSGTIPAATIPTGQQKLWVRGLDSEGNWGNATAKTVFVNGDATVSVGSGTTPARFALEQNWPNPFNPITQIRYALPREANVALAIYNLSGERVRLLRDGREPAGEKTVVWNGLNDSGHPVSSGVYLYRLDADEFGATRKMVLLK